jgi:HD superfamily phosphohydrolase
MLIHDNIHGYIKLSPIASQIVDTSVFQRLRNIHQTGILYLVFPTAVHSRFEHSIGTYYLANKMITNISIKQPELNISNELIDLVSIAGLCHDLGHLLFSHLFDDLFLPFLDNYNKDKLNVHHEHRSVNLLNYLVEKYKIDLTKEQLLIIANLINPKTAEYGKWNKRYQVGKWIFQIVSNPLNSIDVDKFDYLVRDTNALGLKFGFDYTRIISDAKVIDKKLCYSSQCSEDIYHMFFVRYRLYRQIYNHKAVKAIEILIVKLLFELEKEYKISEYISDPEKMIKLTDYFIWQKDSEIIKAIEERKIPKMVYQNVSVKYTEFDEKEFTKHFNLDSYKIVRFKVGYVSGNSANPLNNIYFYGLKTNQIIPDNKVKDFSLLINQKYQEYFLRVYCIDLSKVNEMKNYFKNFENQETISEI